MTKSLPGRELAILNCVYFSQFTFQSFRRLNNIKMPNVWSKFKFSVIDVNIDTACQKDSLPEETFVKNAKRVTGRPNMVIKLCKAALWILLFNYVQRVHLVFGAEARALSRTETGTEKLIRGEFKN